MKFLFSLLFEIIVAGSYEGITLNEPPAHRTVPLYGEVRDSLTGGIITGAIVAQNYTLLYFSHKSRRNYIDSLMQLGLSSALFQNSCFVYGYSDIDGRYSIKYNVSIYYDRYGNIKKYENLPEEKYRFAYKPGYLSPACEASFGGGGLRGWISRGLHVRNHPLNLHFHTVNITQNLFITKSNHSKSIRLKIHLSLQIMLINFFEGMCHTVRFDN